MGNKPTRRAFGGSADWDEVSSNRYVREGRRDSFSSRSSTPTGSMGSSSRRGSSVRQHFVDNQPSRFEQKPTISTAPRTFATDTSFNRDAPLPSPPMPQFQVINQSTSIGHLDDDQRFVTTGVRPAPDMQLPDESYARSLPQPTNGNYQTSLPVAPGMPLPPVPVAQTSNAPAQLYYDSDSSTTTNSVTEQPFRGPALFQVDDHLTSIGSVSSSRTSIFDDDRSDYLTTQIQARRRVPAYPVTSDQITPTGSQQLVIPQQTQYVQRSESKPTGQEVVLLKERTEPSNRINRRIARNEGVLLLQPRGKPQFKQVIEKSSMTMLQPRSTPDHSIKLTSEDMESLGIQTDPIPDETEPIVQPVIVPVQAGGGIGAVSDLQQIPQERKPTTNILPVIIVDKDGSVRSAMPLGEVQLGLGDLGEKRQSTTSGLSVNQNLLRSVPADSIRGPFVPRESATVSHRGSDLPGVSMYRTIDGTARLRGLGEFDVDEIAYPAGSEKFEGTVGTASHITGPSYRLFGDKSAQEHHLHLMQNPQVVANEA